MSIKKNILLFNIFRRMHVKRPTFISFNVTNRCNERCPMCTVWRSSTEELTVGQMEPIFADLKEFGISVVEISGGEPFLRSDIFEVLDLLDRLGLFYTVNTNGTFLSEFTIERLERAKCMLQIAVSLDSLILERYKLLRGADLLAPVLKNIENLSSSSLRVPLKINFTMSRINYQETYEILNYSKSRGLYLSVFPVNQGGEFHHRHNDQIFLPNQEERIRMSQIYRDLAKLRRAGEPLWEYSGFYDRAADYVLGNRPGPCDAGKLYLDLHSDGQLAVCVDQPAIADLRSENMSSVKARIAHQEKAITQCHAEFPCCYTCTYNISLTARNKTAFLAETALVRLLMPVRRLLDRMRACAPREYRA